MAPLSLLFGLLVGSFLNVVILRLPQGQSVVLPRSFCPSCGRFLRWYDNIPLLSFAILGGECRFCKKAISWQYPLVEILTGLLSLVTFWKFGMIPYLLNFLLLICPLIALSFIDLRHRILPDLITLPGIAAGLLVSLVDGEFRLASLFPSLLGILAGGGTLFLIAWIYEKTRRQEGIGMGDVKLAAMLGGFFGWKGVFLTLFLSSLAGSLVGLILIVILRKGLKYAIPFGPFLALGGLVNLYFGRELIWFYLRAGGLLP